MNRQRVVLLPMAIMLIGVLLLAQSTFTSGERTVPIAHTTTVSGASPK
jgi:hypothetical protein